MIPNSSSQSVYAPPGTLRIYPQKATITGDTLIPGNLKVFCKARLGGGVQETVADSKHDRNPTWTQELGFRRKEETVLKFELFNKTFLIGPTFLGECSILLDPVFIEGQVTIKADLLNKGKRIGNFQARLKWEPDGGFRPVSQGYMAQPLVFAGNNFNGVPQFVPVQPQMFGSVGNDAQQSQMFGVRPATSPQQQFYSSVGFAPQMGSHNSNPIMHGPPLGGREEAKEEPVDPNLPDDKKCVVCLDKQKAGAFYRCGHSCCCYNCGRTFIGRPCPICRQIVADFIKVFDS